jgi:hypothetical protein
LALCFAAVITSFLAIGTVGWFALHHDTSTFESWAKETGLFTVGLCVAGIGIRLISVQFGKRRIPNHWIANPNLGAAAMLCEVCAILALPLVPVATLALWAGEWSQGWHVAGHAHDLSFHLARILQSLLLALFLWQWVVIAIRIQGRLAAAAVGRRG